MKWVVQIALPEKNEKSLKICWIEDLKGGDHSED
jgi:hypothetical protein